MEIRSSYLENAHRHPSTLAREARKHLESVKFDTLVGTGLSGALVIPGLARELGVAWLIVRKDDDGSHSWQRVEGTIGAHWLFVDDFISSGATRERVINRMEQAAVRHGFATTYAGDYLYGWPSSGAHPPEFRPVGTTEYAPIKLPARATIQSANNAYITIGKRSA